MTDYINNERVKAARERLARAIWRVTGDGALPGLPDLLNELCESVAAVSGPAASANCPVCGSDKPHYHNEDEATWERETNKTTLRDVVVMLRDTPGFLNWNEWHITDLAKRLIVRAQTVSGPARLQAVIERERTAASHWLEAARKTLNSHRWVTHSRGSYEWDDTEFYKEAQHLFRALDMILDNAEKETKARSFEDCPTTQAEIEAARAPLSGPARTPITDAERKEIANLYWAGCECEGPADEPPKEPRCKYCRAALFVSGGGTFPAARPQGTATAIFAQRLYERFGGAPLMINAQKSDVCDLIDAVIEWDRASPPSPGVSRAATNPVGETEAQLRDAVVLAARRWANAEVYVDMKDQREQIGRDLHQAVGKLGWFDVAQCASPSQQENLDR